MQADEEPGRLWLTGSLQRNPGVQGIVRCARAEPGGAALRFALDASSQYSLHAPARARVDDVSDADLASLVARAARLDLVSNVFVDGRHGSYRNMRVPVRGAAP